MIIAGKSLKALAETVLVEPYEPSMINPASIDLRWSGTYRDTNNLLHDSQWSEPRESEELLFNPGDMFMLSSLEYVTIPDNMCAFLTLKSSMGRAGFSILHVGFFDPGFHGVATLELVNHHPNTRTIYSGQPIAQLVYAYLNETVEENYTVKGRYAGQKVPLPEIRK